jgi:hypothetical protein
MMKRSVLVVIAAVVLGFASEARAQTNPVTALRDIFSIGGFFEDTTEALIGIFQAQTTTFPISSSSGGFTWTFDPQLGVATRRSESFGPMFAERPLTNGRGKLNVTFAFQTTRWKSIADEDLQDGIAFRVTQGSITDEFISQVDLTTSRATVGVSYGVHDRLDVGVVVPFGRIHVNGASILRETVNNQVTFEETIPTEATASGLGDIVLRGKYAFLNGSMFDLAAGVDVRVPSGDEEQLLGSGKAQTKILVIGSTSNGNIAPHFNAGYTFAGSGIKTSQVDEDLFLAEEVNPSNEFGYTFGADIAASPSVTIAADIVGRMLFDNVQLLRKSSGGASFVDFQPGRLNLLLGSIGAKIKIANMWLVTGAVAFPLNSNGIKPGITPVIGFERAF